MHTLWKGAISFGLVNVPVKMFAATEEKDISMRMIHRDCGGPLSFVRKCTACEREVEWAEIIKGYEYEPGKYVLFEKDELDQLSPDSSREIKIVDFVDLNEIDPIYFQKTYYLGPGDTGAGAYNLLMESMKQTNKIGIAMVTIRNKSSLAALRVIGRCLAMETIFYPDEIRSVQQVPNLPEQATVNEKELTMAKMLIEQLSTPFEPDKYQDEHRHSLMDAIHAKIAGEEVRVAPEAKRTNVIDLMAALQASLEAVQSGGAAAASGSGAGGIAAAGGVGAGGTRAAAASKGAGAVSGEAASRTAAGGAAKASKRGTAASGTGAGGKAATGDTGAAEDAAAGVAPTMPPGAPAPAAAAKGRGSRKAAAPASDAAASADAAEAAAAPAAKKPRRRAGSPESTVS